MNYTALDIGSLAWLLPEIKAGIAKARAELSKALDSTNQLDSLLLAKSIVHESVGALQIVNAQGLIQYVQAIEAALSYLIEHPEAVNALVIDQVDEACHALVPYMEELQQEHLQQPVVLFAYYKQLQDIVCSESYAPVDLYFPDVLPRVLQDVQVQLYASDFVGLRQQYEGFLLKVLTDKAVVQDTVAMSNSFIHIAQGQQSSQAYTFWYSCVAVIDCIALSLEEGDDIHKEIKQWLAKLNTLLKRYAQGSVHFSEKLFREALYYVALSISVNPRVLHYSKAVEQMTQAFRLAHSVPKDLTLKHFQRYDENALSQLKQAIKHTKILLNESLERRQVSDGASLPMAVIEQRFLAARKELQRVLELLHTGSMTAPSGLVEVILDTLDRFAQDHHALDEALGIEIASALLVLEQNIVQTDSVPRSKFVELQHRFESWLQGDTSDTSQSLGKPAVQMDQNVVNQVVTKEIISTLSTIEKWLDDFFRNPVQFELLDHALDSLKQMGSLFEMMELSQACLATDQLIRDLKSIRKDGAQDQQVFPIVAQRFGKLGLFVDYYGKHEHLAKLEYEFNPATGAIDEIQSKQHIAQDEALDFARSIEQMTAFERKPALPVAPTIVQTQTQAHAVSDDFFDDGLSDLKLDSLEVHEEKVPSSWLDQPFKQQSSEPIQFDLNNSSAKTDTDTEVVNLELAPTNIEVPTVAAEAESIPSNTQSNQNGDDELSFEQELLDIFIEEAQEVLENLSSQLEQFSLNLNNPKLLADVRRAFHTLKGSGRMVGLDDFGHAAWHVEKCLNEVIAMQTTVSNGLLSALVFAYKQLLDWIERIKSHSSEPLSQTFIDSFEGVLAHSMLHSPALNIKSPEPTLPNIVQVKPDLDMNLGIATTQNPDGNEDAVKIDAVDDMQQALDQKTPEIDKQLINNQTLDLAKVSQTLEAIIDGNQTINKSTHSAMLGDIEYQTLQPAKEPLAAIDMNEQHSQELVSLVDAPVAKDSAPVEELSAEFLEVTTPVVSESKRPKIALITNNVGKLPEDFALSPELLKVQQQDKAVNPVKSRAVQTVMKSVGPIQLPMPLYEIYLAESETYIQQLEADIDQWASHPDKGGSYDAYRLAHSLKGGAATVGFGTLRDVASGLETILDISYKRQLALNVEQFSLIVRAVQRMIKMHQEFGAGVYPVGDFELIKALAHLGSSLNSQHAAISQDAPIAFEAAVHESEPNIAKLDTQTSVSLQDIKTDMPSQPMQLVENVALHDIANPIDSFSDLLEGFALKTPAQHPIQNAVNLPTLSLENISTTVENPLDHGIDFEFGLNPSVSKHGHNLSTSPSTVNIDGEPDTLAGTESGKVDPLTFVTSKELDITPTLADIPIQWDVKLNQDQAAVDNSEHVDALPVIEYSDSAVLGMEVNNDNDAEQVNKTADQSVQDLIAHAPSQSIELDIDLTAPSFDTGVHVDSPQKTVQNVTSAVQDELGDLIGHIKDEIDSDILEGFLSEAEQWLPQCQQLLLELAFNPKVAAELRRGWHTLKGAARMAGAMRIGAVFHQLESELEGSSLNFDPNLPESKSTFQTLQTLSDAVQTLLEPLYQVQPQTSAAPNTHAVETSAKQLNSKQNNVGDALGLGSPITSLRSELVNSDTHMGATTGTRADLSERASALPALRLRTDTLDHLVNQAGEVTSSRGRIDQHIVSLRQSLKDLTENVDRLTNQLREVEIQAESQLSARLEQTRLAQGQFDPLEFDKFTRFQELTRMLSESLSDMISLRDSVAMTLTHAEKDLAEQSKHTRDLTASLMRTRLTQFDAVSERLYRVARQTARELKKQVQLDIQGANVEIDRSIIERMIAPLEHLVRNCVAHGIESEDIRKQAGKPNMGHIHVGVKQIGNEVELSVSDDGAGLDLDKIRVQAIHQGLMTADIRASSQQLAEMIFVPGFSTATQVTEVAGRGIGMDIVRTEASALGGRVTIELSKQTNEQFQPCRFVIRLPLTLAVNQVLLVRVANVQYGIPAALIESLVSISPAELAQAYQTKRLVQRGEVYPFAYLGQLLETANEQSETQHSYAQVLLVNGGDHRVAVHIDHIYGNQEVVVKNIGSLLSRIQGINSATVLAEGQLCLIIDPSQLWLRFSNMYAALNQDLNNDVLTTPAISSPSATAVAPTRRLAMVVDDSLTVRKVTQRLLLREGWQVVLAKDGVDALEQLQGVIPDVMLVDIEMPRMDGFDLTRNVRADVTLKHIPIIMITSRMGDKHRNHAMELGVNAYLGKPYHDEVLLQHMQVLTHKE